MLRTREHLRRMIALQAMVAPAARPWTRRIAFIWPLVSRPTVSADACQNTADNFMGVGTTLLVTETSQSSHNVCVCYLIWIANGCACLPQRGAHALTLPQHYVFQELRQLLFCKGNSNEFVINVQITCQGRYWLISWYQCTILHLRWYKGCSNISVI